MTDAEAYQVLAGLTGKSPSEITSARTREVDPWVTPGAELPSLRNLAARLRGTTRCAPYASAIRSNLHHMDACHTLDHVKPCRVPRVS